MKVKWIINTTATTLLVMIVFLGLAGHDYVVAAQDISAKIEGLLLDQFSAENSADFIVRFTDQADLSPAYTMDWKARGEFVYNTLQDTAAKSQVNAISILETGGLKYETFIAGNELYVWDGTFTEASALAALPEVNFIRATRTYSIDPNIVTKPFDNVTWSGDLLANNALTTVGNSPDGLAWGITYTKADQFWSGFGVRGDGMLVANIDTGVQYNHPALDQSFKCASPTDPACWRDPSNICGAGGACDNSGHGTHTMGTMVGDDDPALTWQAGMAPNAQWIACKGCESSSCSDFALNSCADWILAPGGSTANRPNVVNNSWGGGGGDTWYRTKVQAWVAAGIFPAFSAGNSGPGCGTLGSPGDYQESFGSAAHDSGGTIAGFSSRGPSAAFGHDPYTKPNIASPGVSVCSSVPGNGWDCGYSGTSMASPHSAGAVALLWSCNPALVGQIDATFQILQNSAATAPSGNCGAPADGQGNYTYGYGYLDVLNAGISSCGGVDFGHIDGFVYDLSNTPISGATVSAAPGLANNEIQAITDPTGYYTMTVVVGTYNVTASKVGYAPQTFNGLVVSTGQTTSQDFHLEYLGSWQAGPSMCFDLTRIDAEYFPATEKIYILGGRSDTLTIGTIYSFDPVTGLCQDTGADMPFPISNYTINMVNNGTADVLCTFGGRGSAGTSILNVQCYNPLTNIATSVGNLPAAYTGFTPGAQAIVDNMVYVFGGFRATAAPYEIIRTDRYDPVANTFTQIGNLSIARAYINAAVVDGKIYAFGGTVFDGLNLNALTRTEVMADPAGAGTWDNAAVAELPEANAEGRALGFDTGSPYELAGKILIAGGGQWPGETAEVFTYDVATDTYDYSFPDLLNARRDHGDAFVPMDPGVMWVFGGRQGSDVPPYMPAEFYEVMIGAPEVPDISVSPASLEATLLPDEIMTTTLTISNNGDTALDWSMFEVPAVPKSGIPSGVPQRLSPQGAQAPISAKTKPLLGTIADGSFEAGTPNPNWTEYSLNFGTPLCTVADCGTGSGTGPRTGNWWAWFGGIDAYEEGSVSQNVTLTPDAPILNFWMESFVCDSASDYLEVLVDGTQVFYYDGANPGCGVLGHSLYTVDLTTYADSGVHEIEFHSETFAFNLGVSNFFVDDVALVASNDSVPWLSETPTAGTVEPGSFVEVEVEFDATGLVTGDYFAHLDITSNDPDTPLVSVPVTMTVQAVDLAIAKTDSADPVFFGEGLTYTLTVSNLGPQDATGVTVVDTLPSGVTFVSASAGCSETGGEVTCTVGNLAAEADATFTIEVTVPEEEGVLTNTASVTGNELDPQPGNNIATEDTTVAQPVTDLDISMTDIPDPVLAGNNLTYTIEVINLGPQSATGVVVVDTLPAGVDFISATAGCAHAAGVVTCTIGNLASGTGLELTIVVHVTQGSGTLHNFAEVSGNELDPVVGNNFAEAFTEITPANIKFFLPIIMK